MRRFGGGGGSRGGVAFLRFFVNVSLQCGGELLGRAVDGRHKHCDKLLFAGNLRIGLDLGNIVNLFVDIGALHFESGGFLCKVEQNLGGFV